ncbi:MAG TPA: RDD family protein [Candidatus Limnocylindrales bacterium]
MSETAAVGSQRPGWRTAPRGASPSGLAYAGLTARGVAFLVDGLLASVFIYVVATAIGWSMRWPTDLSDQSGLLLLLQFVAALACVMPTAVAALWWHRSGATPGQRLLHLGVIDEHSGANLSFSAAFARWVLLYAPLALILAYPQIVLTSADAGPFLDLLVLVEMPWLPLVTMTVALAWYLLLAYPALADGSRRRGLHDRLAGSAVVELPRSTARPRSETGQDADLGNLVPFAWFARSRLAWYGWLLTVAALALALAMAIDLVELARIGGDWLWLALVAATAVGTVLLPVALLWRVPGAARRHPVLLLGLALAAALVIGRYLFGLVALDLPPLYAAGGSLLSPLSILAPVVVALGLLALRPRGATHAPLFMLLAAVYLFVPLSRLFALEHVVGDVVVIGGGVFGALTSAFAAWVVLGAWLEREPPRPFWAALVGAAVLGFVQFALGMAMLLVSTSDAPALQPLLSLLSAACAAAAVGLGLVAYWRLAPRD